MNPVFRLFRVINGEKTKIFEQVAHRVDLDKNNSVKMFAYDNSSGYKLFAEYHIQPGDFVYIMHPSLEVPE